MKYIVVGGTSGIGLATSALAAQAGHDVFAVGRDSTKFPAARAAGAATAKLDAANLDESRRFFANQSAFDHLILCASGASGAGNFRGLDLAALRQEFEGKFWPQVNCAQAALALMNAGRSITFVVQSRRAPCNPVHRVWSPSTPRWR